MIEKNNIKAMNIRIPKDVWISAKKKALDDEISLNTLIIECLKKFIKKESK